MSFTSFNLPESIVNLLDYYQFKQPYPIQEKAIPAIMNGKDVLGIAKTGSGKTASYALPLLSNFQTASDKGNREISVLVLVPTRELAAQVIEVFRVFGSGLPKRVKSLAVYGGVSINTQMQSLQGVNILVATPGRLIELTESNAVSLSNIDTLVLDEADKMLDMGFKDEMDRIFSLLPKERQNLLFSATWNDGLAKIEKTLLVDPLEIKPEKVEEEDIESIRQLAYLMNDEDKGPFLRRLIKSKNMQQVLIFVSSSYKADNVANKLRKNGIQASAIHGKKTQGARTEALTHFKAKRVQALVATDLLGRGVDIEGLPYVINYDLPRSPKDYIHRIGRTGRAELSGDAISLVSPEEEHHFKIIQKKMKRLVETVDADSID